MDRLISDEERIRRAEGVLERRRNMNLENESESFINEKSANKMRKILIQIFACLCIYCGLYYANNTQNDFFKNIIAIVKSSLNYDVDFKEIYEALRFEADKLNAKLVNNNNASDSQKSTDDDQDNLGEESQEDNVVEQQDENKNDNTEDNQEQTESEEVNENLGIGGESDDVNKSENTEFSYEDQMQIDATYIKENFSLINPLEVGIITSRFGARESSQIVSANHKGIDLGATTGSIIIAASDGKVIEASSEGDFGIHLKIQKNDVVMIYGHCSELLVNEGDFITQGQQIAKVGSTGKATGPHLHFEIRKDSRAVDPQLILDF